VVSGPRCRRSAGSWMDAHRRAHGHADEHEAGTPTRPATADADAVVDARGATGATRAMATLLQAQGWELDTDHVDVDGHGYKFVRDGLEFDLIAPEGMGARADLTTVPPLRAPQLAGTRQALDRTFARRRRPRRSHLGASPSQPAGRAGSQVLCRGRRPRSGTTAPPRGSGAPVPTRHRSRGVDHERQGPQAAARHSRALLGSAERSRRAGCRPTAVDCSPPRLPEARPMLGERETEPRACPNIPTVDNLNDTQRAQFARIRSVSAGPGELRIRRPGVRIPPSALHENGPPRTSSGPFSSSRAAPRFRRGDQLVRTAQTAANAPSSSVSEPCGPRSSSSSSNSAPGNHRISPVSWKTIP
jgi:hypothetical protein